LVYAMRIACKPITAKEQICDIANDKLKWP
jgi:hypothetical protein